MEKKIKDYLHLYLGCDAMIYNDKSFIMDKVTSSSLNIEDGSVTKIKPILRPLSDMTEQESYELCWQKNQNHMKLNWSLNESAIHPNEFLYLLKQGFDLFGLIESGLAIDKTTIK